MKPQYMNNTQFSIDPDISKAETLPASFYRDPKVFEDLKEKVFLKSWQWIGDTSLVPLENHMHPFTMMEGYLTEPMLLTRSGNDIQCLSNVCSHRGNLVVQHSGVAKRLLCMYHGRRFGLDGAFQHMPEFEQAQNFPRACDSLHKFGLNQWSNWLFVGLDQSIDFQKVIDAMDQRVGFLPLDQFVHRPELSRDYLVNANWVLYCDNYLEGFHIPFVHKDLNAVLDYGAYKTELYEHCNLQIGYADDATEVFDLPEGHVDHGKNIAAYYYWLYPNMMFNFYPWGLSINVIKPLAMDKTKVSFITYVYDESKLDQGAGALLDKVEREDEFVVEGVQKGVRSRFYHAGRYSPTREQGVHHFHQLLARSLAS
ncbi:MAG: Rieske 2Fe-2S domain-containing protein [Cyclobacteriaceae bacterium]